MLVHDLLHSITSVFKDQGVHFREVEYNIQLINK